MQCSYFFFRVESDLAFKSHEDVILRSLDIIVVYLGSEAYVEIVIDLESHGVIELNSENFAVALLNHEVYVSAYPIFKSFRHVDPKSWSVALLF